MSKQRHDRVPDVLQVKAGADRCVRGGRDHARSPRRRAARARRRHHRLREDALLRSPVAGLRIGLWKTGGPAGPAHATAPACRHVPCSICRRPAALVNVVLRARDERLICASCTDPRRARRAHRHHLSCTLPAHLRCGPASTTPSGAGPATSVSAASRPEIGHLGHHRLAQPSGRCAHALRREVRR